MAVDKVNVDTLIGQSYHSYGPFTLGVTHGRQEPHHPSGQQLRALQTGVPIHRHPASCNIDASLSGQLSLLRWGWVCSTLPHQLVNMLNSD